LAYATGSTGLAITVRGSSRRIMIVRFRPANIRLINRRSKLLQLLLALSSGNNKSNNKTNSPIAQVDTVTPYQADALIELLKSPYVFGTWPINRLIGDWRQASVNGRGHLRST